jgi:hypothetical protein
MNCTFPTRKCTAIARDLRKARAAGENFADDREAIRLAKARLVRVCRLSGLAAEQALTRAAAEQRVALVAVAIGQEQWPCRTEHAEV